MHFPKTRENNRFCHVFRRAQVICVNCAGQRQCLVGTWSFCHSHSRQAEVAEAMSLVFLLYVVLWGGPIVDAHVKEQLTYRYTHELTHPWTAI